MKEKLFLIIILIASFFLHLYNLNFPPHPYADGFYYIPAARSYLEGKEDPNLEHPPLGKLIIASGIYILGDNPYGWRIPAIIAGSFSTVVLYFFAKKLEGDNFVALVSILLLNFDTLWFLHSRLEMLDIFVSLFMLTSLFFAWQYYQTENKTTLILCGLFYGLALASKWSAAFVSPLIIALLFIKKKHQTKRVLLLFISLATLVYLSTYALYIKQHGLVNFIILQLKMFGGHSEGKTGIFENIKTAPSWLLFSYPLTYNIAPKIVGQINPFIRLMVLPSLLLLLYKSFKDKKLNIFLVFLAALLNFIPWMFVSRRIYLFYILPAIPFFCLSIAFFFKNLWDRYLIGKGIFSAYLLGVCGFFVGFYLSFIAR